VAVYYKIGVGGTWTLVTLTPVTIGTVNTLITGSLIIPNGSDVYFGVRNVSFADISFGVGNGGGFVGFCGESAPYHYGIVSGNDSVYFNMAVVSNAFVTC
jgi:hypothetical protein